MQELLSAASQHFEAFGQVTLSAQALLGLAQLEQLANQPQAALQLVQQAQLVGGDAATCCKAAKCYAELCGELKRWTEARAALQSGIDMMDKLARSATTDINCRLASAPLKALWQPKAEV